MATSSNIPYPGRKFTSWCDVEKCLDAYGEEKWFAWSIAHSSSIESANLNLKARGETALYDPKLKHKNVILTCTCGGVKRINNGKGLRCHQSTWKTGCRVEVHLKASKTELVVDKFEPEHNHRCDEKFFSALPKIRRRRLQDPKVRATTELLFKAGVKPCKIRSLLRSMDCGQIQQRDLANERARWKKEGLNGKTPEEKLAESLQKLLDADPGAFIYIGKDKDNNLEYLFIQTSAQRKVMEDFGEVLLLDHTYKINRNRMPVTVLMAMDGHGDGRAVGYAFIANEKSSTIGEVLSAFKTSITSAVADRIQTVVVDKDYSEVKAIKLVLPNVNIQLCDFHVSRTFKSTTKAEKPEVKTIITNMRYCSSSSDLAKLVKDLTVLATEQFMKYFKKNWLSCPMAWTFRDRSKSLNLGNNTNNRLENHNSKVKMMLHHNHELYEALDNLLELVQNKEDDVIFRNTIDQVKEAYFMHSTDPIVQSLVKDLTRFAAKLILEELNRTVSAEEVKRFCATEKECLCPHWACYLLPCRHMFSVRRQKGLQVCCTGKINKRWWKTQYHEIVTSDEPECRVFQRVVPKLMPRTTNERYTHSMLKAKAICEVMSESSEKQYSSRYANLEALLQFYSEGKEVAILEILPSSAINLNATTALTILEGEHHVISETPNGKETATVVTPEEISVNSAVHNQTQGTATLTVLEEEQVISVTPIEKETATAVTSGETSVISAVDNSTPVRANSRIEQSFSKPATTLNMTEVQPIAPVCFCGISCIRLVSQPTSRWPNNPFYKCSTNTCRFWQPAKKSKKSLVQSQDIQHTIDYSDLLNCNEPDAIAELVNAIDELENMDETNEKNKDDQLILDNADTTSQNICHGSIEVNLEVNANEATAKKTNGEKEFVSNGQIVSGNVVAEDEVDDEATLNTNGTVDVFQALKGIVLPQPVKQKGRPQGLGKTTFNWTKKTSKPRGFVMRSLEKGPVQTRKDNGLKIPDSDVTKESESEWSVTSQSKGSSDIYRVSKSQTPFCHLCVGTECIHIWACECHDYKFRSTVCKHIHKVMDLDKKSNDKSVTVGHRLSLERSTCDNDRGVALKRPSQRALDVVPSKQQRMHVTVRQNRGFATGSPIDVKPTLKRTTDVVDIVTLSSDSESEQEQFASLNKSQGKDAECPVCIKFGKPKAGDGNAHTCTLCQVPIHAFGCSVSRGSGEEGYGGNDLLCIACSKKQTKTITAPSICQLCRTDAGEGHVCSCHICNMPIDPALDIADTVTCYRCQRTCHDFLCSSLINAVELNVANNKRSICTACEHSLKTGMSLAAFQDIDLQNMLTDEHMQRASSMLKEEFGGKIDGLSCPLSVTYGEKVEEINYYPPRNRARDYLQIMHTGRSNHWVTAVFMKGSSTVTILDSLRTTGLSGHTKMQCAMIAQSDESNVIIVRPPCAQQKNSVDCALYSIAHAVEFCHVGKVQFIDFDPSQLRSHWKQCVETGKLSVFPRRSARPKRTLEEDDVCVLKIYCTCRLPDSVDNMILCELCGSWYHKACEGVKEDPGTSWMCKKCKA